MEAAAFLSFLFVIGILVALGVAAAGVWATYWAVMRGFNQVIAGLQSLDARIAQIAKR